MRHVCKVLHGGGQVVPHNVYTAVAWHGAHYDPAGFLQGGALIVPEGADGLYAVGVQMGGYLAGGPAEVEFEIGHNGLLFYPAAAPPNRMLATGGHVVLKAGGRLDLLVRQWTGGAATLVGMGHYPALWLARLGSVPDAPGGPVFG